MNHLHEQRFGGIARLYGLSAFQKISSSHILVIGIGGVGSWAVEALARTGVAEITLVDLDDICITNTNRQIHALKETVGKFKIEVMEQRIYEINPSCKVYLFQGYLNDKNLDKIFSRRFDYVIDACDDFSNKCLLIDYCKNHHVNLIVIGGAGGKKDPLQIKVTDLSFSQNDKLLMRIRKKLRQDYSFPGENAGEFGIWSVWSHERAVYPTSDGCITFTPPKELSKNMDCSEGFGAASFLTGAFAFAAVSHVIKEISK
jgi:tRNA A37 threonylcarbamoyladenosine dehydratase